MKKLSLFLLSGLASPLIAQQPFIPLPPKQPVEQPPRFFPLNTPQTNEFKPLNPSPQYLPLNQNPAPIPLNQQPQYLPLQRPAAQLPERQPGMAQQPQPAQGPQAPQFLQFQSPGQPQSPGTPSTDGRGLPSVNLEIPLPQKEKLIRFDSASLVVRRMVNSWQIWQGAQLFRDLGERGEDARDIVTLLRELRTTEWGIIGTDRPMLEYGLTNGKPFIPSLPPKHSQMIDIGTVRAEAVRGVWVLRDDANILVNFGPQRNDAEQAAAVCKRYGFNRLAQIGGANPSMSILFAQLGQELGRTPGQNAAMNGVAAVFQEQNLQRTGIEIPGVGYIGERIVIDPRKLEIKRKDRTGPWVIMSGSESLAEFGASEWSARDGLKLLQDLRVTEFCRINDQVSFFLVNGAAPSRVPFAVQSTSFDPLALRIRPASGGTVAVYEGNGRLLFPVRNEAEGEALIKLIKHYKFDQQCQMGLSTRNGLKFLARSGR